MSPSRRTPKVFHSTYRPPQTPAANYRSLRPLLWVLAVVVGLALLSRLPVFTVKSVEVEGTTDPAIIAKLEAIKGHSLFSRFVSLTVASLMDSDLSVSSASCRRGVPDTLRCHVSLRQSAIAWHRADTTYAVDSEGLVYGQGQGGLPLDDRGTAPISLGHRVASHEAVAAYQQIYQGLKDRGYGVNGLFITESLYQVGAVLTGNDRPEIAWKPNNQITTLLITSYPIDSQLSALDEIIKTKKDSVTQSIDLRSPGYAFTR